DYSLSPQFSMFAPVGRGFTVGGSASVSRLSSSAISTTSTGTFYSGALVGAKRFGANSVGVELESLRGSGSLSNLNTDAEPGMFSTERTDSASDISQTRLTAGFSRDLSRTAKFGVFTRYAFIRASDVDLDHTVNGAPFGLNSTQTAGHSAEIGMRLRGAITNR